MSIHVNPDRCTGCRLCLQVCAIEHYDQINPKKAALRIAARFPEPGRYEPQVCTQCGECADVCPEEAIARSATGAYVVDVDRCTNCGVCVGACPEGVIFEHGDLEHVIICDLCFECTDICNTSAIVRASAPGGAPATEE